MAVKKPFVNRQLEMAIKTCTVNWRREISRKEVGEVLSAPAPRSPLPAPCSQLPAPMHLLTIETTCDETAAAIVTDRLEVKASVVASQDDLHRRFGGVVPEIASRATSNVSCQ